LGLLLDTNVLIWLATNDRRLSQRVVDRLTRGSDVLFVSVISGWEYGQKRARKPDELPRAFDQLVAGLPHERLDFVFDCHRLAEQLPPIHRDPFDRMLIAQAMHHDLTLIASDANIARYPVATFW
jgi:PIN domain nuclease of toxin-antitoxin system